MSVTHEHKIFLYQIPFCIVWYQYWTKFEQHCIYSSKRKTKHVKTQLFSSTNKHITIICQPFDLSYCNWICGNIIGCLDGSIVSYIWRTWRQGNCTVTWWNPTVSWRHSKFFFFCTIFKRRDCFSRLNAFSIKFLRNWSIFPVYLFWINHSLDLIFLMVQKKNSNAIINLKARNHPRHAILKWRII